MSRRRVIKKTIYAAGALLVVTAIIVGISLAVLQVNPLSREPTPPPAAFKSIVVEQVDVVSHGTTIDVVARLRNPNPRAGAASWPVTFVLLNPQGQEIGRHQEVTYLLPGSLQYVATIALPISPPLGEVNVELPEETTLTTLPAELDLPTFGSFLRERTQRTLGEAAYELQKGIVRNTSTFDFQRVEMTAVAFDGANNVIGIGKTFLGELKVGEQREFTVQWPAPRTPTTRVTSFPSTNLFLEENIIRVMGDPSDLR